MFKRYLNDNNNKGIIKEYIYCITALDYLICVYIQHILLTYLDAAERMLYNAIAKLYYRLKYKLI